MKSFLKKGLLGLVALLIIAFIGGAIFLLTFDPNVYKQKLVTAVKQRYDRELSINGDFKLSLFPRIGLNADDIRLSEPHSQEQFAHIDHARFAVALWPLLFDRFLIDHIDVKGFDVNILHQADGNFNFDDFFKEAKANLSAEDDHEQDSFALDSDDFVVDVAGLELQDGQLRYHDLKRHQNIELHNLNVHTGRISPNQAFDATLSANLQSDTPDVEGKLNINGLLQFDPVLGLYSAKNLNLGLNGSDAHFGQSQAGVKGNFDIDTKNGMLKGRGVALSLNTKGEEHTDLEDLDFSMAAPTLNFDISQTTLVLKDLAINANAQTKQQQNYSLELKSPDLNISPSKAQGQPLTGVLHFEGQEKADLNLSFKDISGTAGHIQIGKVTVNGIYAPSEARNLQFDFDAAGHIRDLGQQFSLDGINGKLKLKDYDNPQQEMLLIGKIKGDLPQRQLSMQMDALFDNEKLSLKGELHNFSDPRVNVDLQADKIVLDRLIDSNDPKQAEEAEQQESAKADETAQETSSAPEQTQANDKDDTNATNVAAKPSNGLSFKQDLLSRLSGVGTFNIASLVYHDTEFKDLGATLLFDASSTMSIKSLKAKVFEGQLSLNSDFDLHGDRFRVDGDLRQVQLRQLWPLFKQLPLIEGQADLVFDVQGTSLADQDIAQSLSGKLNLKVNDGKLNGVDFLQWLEAAKADPQEHPSFEFYQNASTAFQQLQAQAALDHGILTFKHLQWLSPQIDLERNAFAYADMAKQSLYLPLMVHLKNGVADVAMGGVRINVRNLKLPLTLEGTYPELQASLKKDLATQLEEAKEQQTHVKQLLQEKAQAEKANSQDAEPSKSQPSK
ncbi:AsmA family protein [Brackiella oedipodis]|uniref:AsmA family protein n=1 Tax=Brackiella oedipodis TaxID=124225 RepID=UPI00048B0CFD|nr:AsmA family protein [Brackiella oedipodis]